MSFFRCLTAAVPWASILKKAAALEAELEANRAELQSRDIAMKLKDDEIAELRKRIERLEGRQ